MLIMISIVRLAKNYSQIVAFMHIILKEKNTKKISNVSRKIKIKLAKDKHCSRIHAKKSIQMKILETFMMTMMIAN